MCVPSWIRVSDCGGWRVHISVFFITFLVFIFFGWHLQWLADFRAWYLAGHATPATVQPLRCRHFRPPLAVRAMPAVLLRLCGGACLSPGGEWQTFWRTPCLMIYRLAPPFTVACISGAPRGAEVTLATDFGLYGLRSLSGHYRTGRVARESTVGGTRVHLYQWRKLSPWRGPLGLAEEPSPRTLPCAGCAIMLLGIPLLFACLAYWHPLPMRWPTPAATFR